MFLINDNTSHPPRTGCHYTRVNPHGCMGTKNVITFVHTDDTITAVVPLPTTFTLPPRPTFITFHPLTSTTTDYIPSPFITTLRAYQSRLPVHNRYHLDGSPASPLFKTIQLHLWSVSSVSPCTYAPSLHQRSIHNRMGSLPLQTPPLLHIHSVYKNRYTQIICRDSLYNKHPFILVHLFISRTSALVDMGCC